jgi:hypothetical protein
VPFSARYAGIEIKMDDRKLLILKESDILAIVKKRRKTTWQRGSFSRRKHSML